VFLWSTGFIAAKYITPYAEPFTFLTYRYFIAGLILFVVAFIVREKFALTKKQFWQSVTVAVMLHVIYIGGVFYAVSLGVTSGVSAVIVSLQPVLVGILAVPILGERLRGIQIVGLILGVVGVAILLLPKIFEGDISTSFSAAGIIVCVIALLGTTGGYIVQKKTGADIPFITGTAIQYGVSAIIFAGLALTLEDNSVQWTNEFIFGLSWSILANSIVSIVILYTLLRHGSAQRASSLYYLVPPAAALMAYFLFDERITSVGLVGMALAGLGVMLVMRENS
jgi:drug/metabolite transporter (DMT)-like permease